MTPEAQRIAIAEACGWKTGYRDPEAWHPLPDYLNDLNAMHEAVSIFDYDQADGFEDHLCDICKRLNDEKENPAPWRFAVVNATASQRAEAFLRTIGKWKELK
jgi:hypothetical protein